MGATLPNAWVQACRWQARTCESMGAPFTAAVVECLANEELVGDALAPLLELADQRDTKTLLVEAWPIRAAAALHFIALAGRDPNLARHYHGLDPDGLGPAVARALRAHENVLRRYLSGPPQTNEVGRSFALIGGFLRVAAATGLPLRCFELGSSAGLNQCWNRFHYSFGGGATWGDPNSPVHLHGEWHGVPPPPVPVVVASSRGCDLNPLPLATEDARVRALSYIWPDQPGRLARMRSAIDIEVAAGIRAEQADAVAWTQTNVSVEPRTATVLFHSIFFQYLSAEAQEDLADAIERIGSGASEVSPFAWLRMEIAPDDPVTTELRLRTWPGGDEVLLGRTHSHGAHVEWLV